MLSEDSLYFVSTIVLFMTVRIMKYRSDNVPSGIFGEIFTSLKSGQHFIFTKNILHFTNKRSKIKHCLQILFHSAALY